MADASGPEKVSGRNRAHDAHTRYRDMVDGNQTGHRDRADHTLEFEVRL